MKVGTIARVRYAPGPLPDLGTWVVVVKTRYTFDPNRITIRTLTGEDIGPCGLTTHPTPQIATWIKLLAAVEVRS